MIIRSSILAGTAVLLGLAGGAEAADLANYDGGSMKDGYAPMHAASPSWYLRLDGAYASFDDPVMVEDGIATLANTSIDNSWSIGGGVGMYFSKSVRGDVTYEHMFEADAQGDNLDPVIQNGHREFGIKSDVFLANLYYDFDMGHRFSPYIGVGLGFTRNTTTDGTVPDCGCAGPGTIESDEKWSVAAALMGGFTLALRDRLSLDAGYRFLYLGDAATGPILDSGGVVVVNDPIVEDIHAHEVRVGLRWDIR